MKTLVMKFGGTSVGGVEAIDQATGLVLEQAREWERVAVVVSAMSGVTDALIQSAQAAACGDDRAYRAIVSDLRVRHHQTVDGLLSQESERIRLLVTVDRLMDELAAFCYSIHILGEVTPRAMDAITSLGEPVSYTHLTLPTN